MKRVLLCILIIALMVPVGQALSADTTKKIKVSYAPIHYVIDGMEFSPPSDQLGFIYIDDKNQGHTYVPLRFVASILNKSVIWDGTNYKVTVAAPLSEEWKTIREYLGTQEVADSNIQPVDPSKITSTSITVSLTNVSYEFDGKLVAPNANTPGFLYNSRIYVPLRFMYESLGFEPVWDQQTYSITTETDPEQLEYQAIIKKNDKIIVEKKAACEADITDLVLQFLVKQKTMTEEEKLALFAQGEGILADCKSELAILLDDLSEELTAADQPIDIVAQYQTAIDEREQYALSLLEKYR